MKKIIKDNIKYKIKNLKLVNTKDINIFFEIITFEKEIKNINIGFNDGIQKSYFCFTLETLDFFKTNILKQEDFTKKEILLIDTYLNKILDKVESIILQNNIFGIFMFNTQLLTNDITLNKFQFDGFRNEIPFQHISNNFDIETLLVNQINIFLN